MIKFARFFPLFIFTCFAGCLQASCPNWAVLTDPLNNSVSIIDLTTNMSFPSNVPLMGGTFPIGIVISPDGKFAYTANNVTNNVTVIDLTVSPPVALFNTSLPTLPMIATGSYDPAISTDGKTLYVANSSSANVSVVDVSTNPPTALINIQLPGAVASNFIAVNPKKLFAYTVNQMSHNVSVINLNTNTFITNIPLPAGSLPTGMAISPDGNFGYVTLQMVNAIAIIDLNSNMQTGTIPLSAGAIGPVLIAITPDGKYAYTACGGSASVAVVNLQTNMAVTNIHLPGGSNTPEGIAITPDGKLAYIANVTSHDVSVIDIESNTVASPNIAMPAGTTLVVDIAIVSCSNSQTNGSVQGIAKRNRDFWQTDLYNVISWNAPSGFTTVSYSIYQNGTLIGEVAADTLSFEEHYLNSRTTYNYTVYAVDANGNTLLLGAVSVETKKG